MKRIPILCAVVFGLFGCVGESTDSTSQFVSCYDTGHGVKCVNTSKLAATADVDVNGTIDHLVCANGDGDGADPTSQSSDSGPSSSDDANSQSSDTGLGGAATTGGVDDSASDESGDSTSDSGGGAGCGAGAGTAGSDSDSSDTQPGASDSNDGSDSDADNDGVSDSEDCDCVDPDGDGTPPGGDAPIG